MGASGAGKTTLLNCLTFRNTGKLKIRGTRFLNDKPVNTNILSRISGYVQQDELFIGTLKVVEVLVFQSLLRMDKHLTHEERKERVEQVILEFGLTKCRNTFIGSPERGIKGISGGERKRLAFACEVSNSECAFFVGNIKFFKYGKTYCMTILISFFLSGSFQPVFDVL